MSLDPAVQAELRRQRDARDAQYVLHDAHKRSKHRHIKVAACDACRVEARIAYFEWTTRGLREAGVPRGLR